MMLYRLVLPSLVLAAATSDTKTQPGEEASTRTSMTIDAAVVAANQTTMPTIMMPEAKRVPDDGATMWSPPPPPSPSDLTPIMMHHQLTMPPAAPIPQPQALYPAAAVAHSPSQQHFMPAANYHFAEDEYPGNQYGQPTPPPPPIIGSNEYRSEHYSSSYPPFEQPNYPLLQQQTPPPSQQQQIDTSLIPTAKHFVLVSFIGLLLLFAIIQNSISAARRKDALVEVLSNRKKRDIVALTNFNKMTPELRAALKEDARVRCIQRTLCYETRKLHQDLGDGFFGNLLGKYLTRNVSRFLEKSSPGWDRLVQDAADAGSRGDDCDILYSDCSSSGGSQTLFTDPTEIRQRRQRRQVEE